MNLVQSGTLYCCCCTQLTSSLGLKVQATINKQMTQLTNSVIQHHAVSSMERSGVGANGLDSSPLVVFPIAAEIKKHFKQENKSTEYLFSCTRWQSYLLLAFLAKFLSIQCWLFSQGAGTIRWILCSKIRIFFCLLLRHHLLGSAIPSLRVKASWVLEAVGYLWSHGLLSVQVLISSSWSNERYYLNLQPMPPKYLPDLCHWRPGTKPPEL